MAKDICQSFGERLRELRKHRGWRQLDLAEQAGISENYVSELELGQKEVCLRTIAILSKALGIAIEDIVKGLQ
jgi:XRE family transcriptional regulator, regulator of sulfur utilization